LEDGAMLNSKQNSIPENGQMCQKKVWHTPQVLSLAFTETNGGVTPGVENSTNNQS
jgi:hypothetical protein